MLLFFTERERERERERDNNSKKTKPIWLVSGSSGECLPSKRETLNSPVPPKKFFLIKKTNNIYMGSF
jgi:hypothetical protein